MDILAPYIGSWVGQEKFGICLVASLHVMWKCSYFVLHAQFLDTTSNLLGLLGVADQVFKLQFKRWTVVEDLSIRWNVDL